MPGRLPTKTLPLCLFCQRFRLNAEGGLAYAAFPAGIPTQLLEGEADHRQPYPGDQVIRFEPDWNAPSVILAEFSRRNGTP